MTSQVTVYSTPTCTYCRQVERFLTERCVQYAEVDVSAHEAAAFELVRRTKQYGVPVIDIDEASDRILGVHMVAENAGDVIYAGVLAVKFNLTVHDLVDMMAPCLTMAEGPKLTAQTFGRDISKLSCCAV